jgi:16S rRNA (cytosine967-C5)-methyltransferase
VSGESRLTSRRVAVDDARRVAYLALRAVDDADAYLNLTLSRLLSEHTLDRRNAAFATELTSGTARLQGSYDAILEVCVSGGIRAVQPEVRTALHLGCHQLLSMRVSAHAAVSTSVELVREFAGERPVRLANAVLRRVSTQTLDAWITARAPARGDDLAGHLAVRYSHPRWIVSALLAQLGDMEAEQALAADNVAAPVTLVARPGLATAAELLVDDTKPGRWSPYAVLMKGGDPSTVAAVRDGRAGVQDEGSQLAALALARAGLTGPDRRWLDACAGPGGKAALLAGLGGERGVVLLAAERQPHRARLVATSLRRYGRGCAVVIADSTRPPWQQSSFDRVLVDAPCTGLGALRRRPEARWRRQPSDLDALVPLQHALLLAAVSAVRPGGIIGYVTCSPHPAETRGVVDAVLRERSDVTEVDARPLLDPVSDLGPGPSAQLWPHRHGTDAMFVSLLRRTADHEDDYALSGNGHSDRTEPARR